MNMWKQLDPLEEKEFRHFVDEDKDVIAFLKKAQLWHPVVRDELCKRLSK